MSRRHLTFVVVAIASLAVGACSNSSSPTGPQPSAASHDEFTPPADSSGRIGTMGSH